jgi:hypothetical protein
MINYRPYIVLSLVIIAMAGVMGCNKSTADPNPTVPPGFQLKYGDSIFYQKNIGVDYLVFPKASEPGTYSAFPDGIEIDDKTGAINVSKSETGLRYKITFTPTGSTREYSTTILLSGINYLDQFYFLSNNDTIARPVYNGSAQNVIPISASGTAFDIGLGCNNEGIAVNTSDGRINLMETIRNGFFGRYPDNGTRKEFELKYKIDDNSQQSLNALKIKIYYFATMNDVTPDLIQLLHDREGTVFGANINSFPGEILSTVAGVNGVAKAAKPRPPCIFIIGR